MKKKQYRNALRSRAMIREAFIALLKEKPLEQIKVVDIVNKADLSRNTFYAHYQDVYAVLEEFQHELVDELTKALNEAVQNQLFDKPLPLLLKICEHIDAHKSVYCVLLDTKPTTEFVHRLKQIIIECITRNIASTNIGNERGMLFFVQVLAAGFWDYVQRYLCAQTELSINEIAEEISRIWSEGLAMYR